MPPPPEAVQAQGDVLTHGLVSVRECVWQGRGSASILVPKAKGLLPNSRAREVA